MNNRDPSASKGRLLERAAWIGLILAAVIATVAAYLLLDERIVGWLRDHPNTWHRIFWVDGLRQMGKATVPIWLLLAWGCLTNRWRPAVIMVVAMILVGASVTPLKVLVGRARPRTVVAASRVPELPARDIPWQKRVSFPSGDTAVAFGAAVVLSSLAGRPWMPVFLTLAGAVGALRVTVLAHYPSDVLAGALVGVLCGTYALRRVARLAGVDGFRVGWRGRLAAGLVLILVTLLPLPWSDLRAVSAFVKVYLLPLTAVVLLHWVLRRWGRGGLWHETRRSDSAAAESGSRTESQPQKSCVGGKNPGAAV